MRCASGAVSSGYARIAIVKTARCPSTGATIRPFPPSRTSRPSADHLFALDADYKVLAPYVLVSSTLAFHALGRSRGGGLKGFRNLFFSLEEIAPAYQPPWNFRDRGLWVAKQRLRPFSPGLRLRPIPDLTMRCSLNDSPGAGASSGPIL
jgi:hypothetical protein